MQIKPSEKARETCPHPFVREHHETGTKALFSSAAYIQSFEGMSLEDSQALAMELYVYQTQEKFQYRHKWEKDMLVIWDNRSLLTQRLAASMATIDCTSGHHCGHPVVSGEKIALWGY